MRRVLLLAAVAVVVTLSSPSRAQFCPGAAPWVFDDVPVGDLFCTYITWAAQNGITLGCAVIDANHRLYCPNDAVTRSQMAAFVNRLGNVRVEAVGTGPGLTGGPITSVGTINLATTQLLPTVACASGQVPQWNGSAWACGTPSTGTVTSVGSGTGLTGGPITSSGSLSIATGYQLPQGCTNGQVAKSSGSNAWTCANDVNSGGTVTSVTAGNGLTGGTITTAGTIAVDPASTTLTGNFFRQGGNAFGATAVLGTADNNAIDTRVNGSRVMRYEPNAISPNVIGGHPSNNALAGVRGGTIAGGGVAIGDVDPDFSFELPNLVRSHYAGIGGGFGNIAGNSAPDLADGAFAYVGGGQRNQASGRTAFIGGGSSHVASGFGSAIGGGNANTTLGTYSGVASGQVNQTPGDGGFVGGGAANKATALYSTVPGGSYNIASGILSLAWGNESEARGDFSIALGRRAKTFVGTNLANGAFVFADNNDFDFAQFQDNRFAARATGGVQFVVGIDANGATTNQCYLPPGGSAWNCSSDRSNKQNLVPLDGRDVLARLVSMPLYAWSPKTGETHVRHFGPMAQDFFASFELGSSNLTIGHQDADGVAMAAIQGLNAKVEAQARDIESLHARYASEIAELRRAVEILMARTSQDATVASR